MSQENTVDKYDYEELRRLCLVNGISADLRKEQMVERLKEKGVLGS